MDGLDRETLGSTPWSEGEVGTFRPLFSLLTHIRFLAKLGGFFEDRSSKRA